MYWICNIKHDQYSSIKSKNLWIPLHLFPPNCWQVQADSHDVPFNYQIFSFNQSLVSPNHFVIGTPKTISSFIQGNHTETISGFQTSFLWFSVKLDHFPKDQGENENYLKPPPSWNLIPFQSQSSSISWFFCKNINSKIPYQHLHIHLGINKHQSSPTSTMKSHLCYHDNPVFRRF